MLASNNCSNYWKLKDQERSHNKCDCCVAWETILKVLSEQAGFLIQINRLILIFLFPHNYVAVLLRLYRHSAEALMYIYSIQFNSIQLRLSNRNIDLWEWKHLEPWYPRFHTWIHEPYELVIWNDHIHRLRQRFAAANTGPTVSTSMPLPTYMNSDMNSYIWIHVKWIHTWNDHMNSWVYEYV